MTEQQVKAPTIMVAQAAPTLAAEVAEMLVLSEPLAQVVLGFLSSDI
jgi:hypothetical protein